MSRRGIWTMILLMSAAALVLIATFVASGRGAGSGASRRPQGTSPEHLTLAWQREKCRPDGQANLSEIELPQGKVADVEILDVLGVRIYLPRPWTAYSRHFYGPSPDGFSVRTGGSGTNDPWLGPGSNDACRGQAYASIPGKRADDPRFKLGIVFRRYSTRSVSGGYEEQQGKFPFAHQIVEFTFFGPENDDPDSAPLLMLPTTLEREQEKVLGDGWHVVVRDNERRDAGRRVRWLAFDARALKNGEPVARAVKVREGWSLVFPLADRIKAVVVIERDVPVARWRRYREKAEKVYRWLQTKPAERDALPNSF